MERVISKEQRLVTWTFSVSQGGMHLDGFLGSRYIHLA